MPMEIILGGSGGDEAKAKLIDYLARDVDYVVRFTGGANAGHTVIYRDRKFILHLVNAGIFHNKVVCLSGAAMVIDPWQVIEELEACVAVGAKKVFERFRIDPRAHIVFPHHIVRDSVTEDGRLKIGSTKRGIGPAYSDKALRIGIRFGDLLNDSQVWYPRLQRQLEIAMSEVGTHLKKKRITAIGTKRKLLAIAPRLVPMITDISSIIHEALEQGAKVVGEGAQGALIDIDHGTYPNVTSSNSTIGGTYAGMGIGPTKGEKRTIILKAYTTFVGERYFPWEMPVELGDRVRLATDEYGATSKRPRRIGWFSAPHVRLSRRINSAHHLVLTKVDCYGNGFLPEDKIKVVEAFEYNGTTYLTWSADITDAGKARPIYGPGFAPWRITPKQGRKMMGLQDLPKEARAYVLYLEELLQQKFRLISCSPYGDQMIVR
ncbi:MAG: adenylosuccinate synthetase [Patescibacteria group bacterium]